MIAKYPGLCMFCHKPIAVGVDTYDPDIKKSYHEDCRENQPPGPEAYELAARLGFIEYSQDMAADGILLRMQRRTGSPATGRTAATPCRHEDAVRSMFGDEEGEVI